MLNRRLLGIVATGLLVLGSLGEANAQETIPQSWFALSGAGLEDAPAAFDCMENRSLFAQIVISR